MSRYIDSKHDKSIRCKSCGKLNAPQSSSDFERYCHNCGVELNTEAPVEKGDVVKVHIEDIHHSGGGLGRMKNGFVIIVEDVIPVDEETVKAKVKNVKESSAVAESVERDLDTPDYIKTSEEDEDENDETRKDWWGN